MADFKPAAATSSKADSSSSSHGPAWTRCILVDWARNHAHASLVINSDEAVVDYLRPSRQVIERFVRRWVGAHRRQQQQQHQPTSADAPSSFCVPSLDWVVPALLSSSSSSRQGQGNLCEAAFDLVTSLVLLLPTTERTHLREQVLAMYVWVYEQKQAKCSTSAAHISKLLLPSSSSSSSPITRRAGQLATRRVLELVQLAARRETTTTTTPGYDDDETSLLRAIQLAHAALRAGSSSSSSDLMLAVSLADGCSLLGLRLDTWDALVELTTAWVDLPASPEGGMCATAGGALHWLATSSSSSARSSFAECAPYVLGLSFAIERLTHNLLHPPTAATAASSSSHHALQQQQQPISIQLVRAPTQEEYFRASLRDPILSLRCIPTSTNNTGKPLVSELLSMIATELDMDADLLELIVCNKILKPTLDLGLVFERVWKPHVRARRRQAEEARALRQQQRQLLQGQQEDVHDVDVDDDEDDDDEEDDEDDVFGGGGRDDYDEDEDELMPITYRIVAIDGEANEDFITELAPNDNDDGDKTSASSSSSSVALLQQTKALAGQGFAALVMAVQQAAASVSSSWPADVRSTLVKRVVELVSLAVQEEDNRSELGGLVPALLDYCFRFPACAQVAPVLALLERLCAAEGDGEAGEDGSALLDVVLGQLDAFAGSEHQPSLSRLLPMLTRGRDASAAKLLRVLPSAWLESVLFECNSHSHSAFLLVCHRAGITQQCVSELTCDGVVHKSSDDAVRTLRLLRGLAREPHSAELICQSQALRELVLIEELPNARVALVGDLAQDVLEALATGSEVGRLAVQDEQAKRKHELAAQSSRKRKSVEKAQQRKQHKMMAAAAAAMGMGMEEEEETKSSSSSKRARAVSLVLEDGGDATLRCCVCYDGLQAKPDSLLCVYVYGKPTTTSHSTSTGTAGTGAVSTVSSFVCIHAQCHDAAFAAEKAGSSHSHSHHSTTGAHHAAGARKDEWEGAQIRNGHAACNNLLPLASAAASSPLYASAYNGAQQHYFDRLLGACTSATTARERVDLVCRDVRLLLLRVAFEESLTCHTGGGSIESNLALLVPMLQLVRHLHATSDVLLLMLTPGRDQDVQFVSTAIYAKVMSGGGKEEWAGEVRSEAVLQFARWAEHTAVSGSLVPGVAKSAKHQSPSSSAAAGGKPPKLRPWLVFAGLVDFVRQPQNFDLERHTVYEMLDASKRMAALARRLLSMPAPPDPKCLVDMLVLGGDDKII